MKHLKQFENNSEEYLLIVHFESRDEIHLDIINYSFYPKIEEVIANDPNRVPMAKIEEMLKTIYDNRVFHLVCQTYVLEKFDISKYNIVKVIHLPELGM